MSLRELLKGIDETGIESSIGWWETSKGSEFGALILNQALALEAKLEAENQALRNELEGLKASQNKIKADAICDLADNYINGPITTELTVEYIYEHANKLEQDND